MSKFKQLTIACLLLGATVTASAANGVFGGGDGSNGNPYIVEDAADLDAIRKSSSLSKSYKLAKDIDLTDYLAAGGNGYAAWGSEGWLPIGESSAPFTGTFNGDNHTISGLWINRPTPAMYGFSVGLFGYITPSASPLGGFIENLNVEIAPAGIISGNGSAGGLLGATSNVFSASGVAAMTIIKNCHVTGGDISGYGSVGGLVGRCNFSVNNSSSTCNVIIPVKNKDYAGGLIGYLLANTEVVNCYATGNVTIESNYAGGLIGGYDSNSKTIRNCYASGNVSAGNYAGGFIGKDGSSSKYYNCFFDTETSGLENGVGEGTDSDNITGLPTAEMKQKDSFTDWDFKTVWKIDENISYPYFGLTEEEPNSIETAKALSNHKIYPNPTNGMVYIETADAAALKLYDMLSNLLIETKGKQVDMSGFATGIYLLQVDGETFKVVKK